MAREHARILLDVWNDKDFQRLSPDAQRLYFLLLSQKTINNAGVLPLMVSKWARGSTGTTADDVRDALAELERRRYVLTDADTEEALVRSFIRRDGVAKHKYMLKNALTVALLTESPKLRRALAVELRRLGVPEADTAADELDSDPTPTPPDRHSDPTPTTSERQSDAHGEGEGVVTLDAPAECSVDSDFTSANDAEGDDRLDVQRLCDHLADRIVGNGRRRRPRITETWRDAARLLMDRDGVTEEQAHRAIDWCQDHEFWRSTIRSMPKLREQYDQLRLQALRGRRVNSRGYQSQTDANIAALLSAPSPPQLLAIEGGLG